MLLTRKEIEEIRDKERAAEQQNPGPWSGDCVLFDKNQKELLYDARTGSMGVKSVPVARFMAGAKTDVPRLVSHANALRWAMWLSPYLWVIWLGMLAWRRVRRFWIRRFR